jgi:outer membrane immunogenic protein
MSLRVISNRMALLTLAARFGVLATERALFYVKGGDGWVGANEFTVINQTTGGTFSTSNSNNVGGWLAGAGIEYAFAPNWTAKVEYDFLGLSNMSFTVLAGAFGFSRGDTFSTSNRDLQMLTVGFNYLFTGW